MATKIETLVKPNGDEVLPRTRAKAVSMENGVTVETAINTTIEQMNGKADSVHNHDDRYYTGTEIDTAFVNVIYMNDTDNENIVETNEFTALVNRVNELDSKAVTTVPQTLTKEQKTQARENIGAAPKSCIFHGTIEDDGNVTLTDFDWDELVAAINVGAYVVAQITTVNGNVYEFPLSNHYVDDQWATFTCDTYFGSHGHGFDVESDGTITSYELARTKALTFTYEDGTTRTIEVYVK